MNERIKNRLIYLDGRKYDISGSAGNAFAILGTIKGYMRQCDVPKELIELWQKDATSGNYDHLLEVCHMATGIEFVNGKEGSEWLN